MPAGPNASPEWTPPPTLEEVREWCQVSVESCDDKQLAHVLAAETQLQADACSMPSDPDGEGRIPEWAYQAQLRRCGRELAARGIQLGITMDGEYGSARLPSWDGEIARLEGNYRRFVFA